MQNMLQGKEGKKLARIRISIKTRMIISYFLCVAVPLIIVNIFYSNNSRKALKNTSSQLATQMVQQASMNISSFNTQLDKLANRIVINELNASSFNLITDYIIACRGKTPQSTLDKFNIKTNMISQLRYSVNFDESVLNIALTIGDDVITTYTRNSSPSEIPQEEFNEYDTTGKLTWVTNFPGYDGRVFAIRNLNSMQSAKSVGKFIMEVNIKHLVEQVQAIKLFEGAEVFLLDVNGEVLSATEGAKLEQDIVDVIKFDNEIGKEEINGKLISYAKSSNNWTIVTSIPVATLTQTINKADHMLWILIIISAMTATLAGFLISRDIVQAILQIRASMKQAETGDLSAVVTISSHDELGELGISFNHMMINIRRQAIG